MSIHGLMPGREYDLELRLAYGSGASIGVGTRLRLSVPSSGGGDGGGDGTVVGKPLLETAFGGRKFEAAEGTLGAVLARDLLCEWEWVKALEGGGGGGGGGSSVSGSSGSSKAVDGALRGVVHGAHSSESSGGRAGAGMAADRAASGSEGGDNVQAEMGAMAWVVGAFAVTAVVVVGCVVARVKRRSRSAEGVSSDGGSVIAAS